LADFVAPFAGQATPFARQSAFTNTEDSVKMTVGVASALLLLVSVASASAQSLPGKFQVERKNLDESAYSGTTEIVATSEVTCRITWQTGSTTSEGICAQRHELRRGLRSRRVDRSCGLRNEP
jgi:phage baseplate assembly protein gpV